MRAWLNRLTLTALLATAACAAHAQTPAPEGQFLAPVLTADEPLNDAKAQKAHYVILVSLDGFRYDYPQKYNATHLIALGKRGASTPSGMLPSYRSITFPNHLTLVTGLYPEHHGIIGNKFWCPDLNTIYNYKDAASVADGRFYTGVPLWSLAEQQHMRAASFFWPGSEAKIADHRPAYYLNFDDKFDDAKRVDQLIQWLQLPVAERPHFLSLYYSNTDHAGHDYGPDSTQVRDAVHHVDEMIGELERKVAALHLPVDIIVTADHGMAHPWETIYLDQYVDLTGIHAEGSFLYPETDAEAQRITDTINAKLDAAHDDRFRAVRRKDVAGRLHYDANVREGDPVMIPNGQYEFFWHKAADAKDHMGEHGYDPLRTPEMKAIFFAVGPDIKPGTKLPTFENVDVYPFIAHILGLKPPTGVKLDGDWKPLASALVIRK